MADPGMAVLRGPCLDRRKHRGKRPLGKWRAALCGDEESAACLPKKKLMPPGVIE